MFSKFYIKFNYENIIPFNLKKKKLRVHANLIANKAVAAQGFFFGVKIKFWYYYYGINGLKRDNVLLIKNSSNKRLSVFFISNFNMIEGKWALPKIYEEYYQRFWFLKKKKFNLMRIALITNNNNITKINIFKFINNNIYKINYVYNLNIFNILNIKINNIYFNKFLRKNSIPIIYNYKKKIQNLKLYNNYKKKILNKIWDKYHLNNNINYSINKYIFGKYKKDFILNIKQKIIIKHLLLKALINIKQFLKLYKILNKTLKNNILFIFYKFFISFRFFKTYKNSNNKIWNFIYKKNEKNIIKLIVKQHNLRKKNKINYINILKKNLKYIYVFKIFYNKSLKKKNIFIYNKFINKISNQYNNILKRKKKNWTYFINFYLFGKNNLLYILKNKRIKRLKYKKIRKQNYLIKSLFFKKTRIHALKIKRLFKIKKFIITFFNSRNKKKRLKKNYNKYKNYNNKNYNNKNYNNKNYNNKNKKIYN